MKPCGKHSETLNYEDSSFQILSFMRKQAVGLWQLRETLNVVHGELLKAESTHQALAMGP
jgi:hypothetical protein